MKKYQYKDKEIKYFIDILIEVNIMNKINIKI